MRKVAFVVGFYPFERGGAEYQAYLLAQALAKDFEIVFVSCGEKADGFTECDGFGVYTIRSNTYRGIRTGMYRLYSRVSKILQKIDPDIIYQRVVGPATSAVARYARKHDRNFVWHIASEANVRPLRRSVKNFVQLRLLEKKVIDYGISRATFVIAQAQYQCDLLKKNYGRGCDAVVPNFHPFPSVSIDKSDPLTVVWISNLKSLKRPDVFLDIAELFRERDDVKLLMIGRQTMPSLSYRIEKTAALNPNFQYLGEVSQEQVSNILARAHLLVNTSEYEGFPNTFIQAWLHQVPVVSLNVNPDKVLTAQKIGVCSKSMTALVTDIERLLKDSSLRQYMGRNAVRYAKQHHSIDNAGIIADIFNR